LTEMGSECGYGFLDGRRVRNGMLIGVLIFESDDL